MAQLKPEIDLIQYWQPICATFKMNSTAKLILKTLLFRAQLKPDRWHLTQTDALAVEWGLGKNSVTRGLQRLHALGLIHRKGQRFRVDALHLMAVARQGKSKNHQNRECDTLSSGNNEETVENHRNRDFDPNWQYWNSPKPGSKFPKTGNKNHQKRDSQLNKEQINNLGGRQKTENQNGSSSNDVVLESADERGGKTWTSVAFSLMRGLKPVYPGTSIPVPSLGPYPEPLQIALNDEGWSNPRTDAAE
ncbi:MULTISPECIES: hypothetical protein [unclassified Ruegeria]|uniref:hypothetical protein n=1 Tax=unclassified Ruegeria TaxID=2625375 RepID=UPI001479EEEA|nr:MULTISPECIES: hypothetical protein [unclassified Ruegeria]